MRDVGVETMGRDKTYSTETTRVNTRTTRFACLTNACHPLDSDAVSKLDG
jgi:hypothetical protein